MRTGALSRTAKTGTHKLESGLAQRKVASSVYREIVAGVMTVTAGPTKGPYEQLEPDDAKVSSPVPRGLGASNGPRPPDAAQASR